MAAMAVMAQACCGGHDTCRCAVAAMVKACCVQRVVAAIVGACCGGHGAMVEAPCIGSHSFFFEQTGLQVASHWNWHDMGAKTKQKGLKKAILAQSKPFWGYSSW